MSHRSLLSATAMLVCVAVWVWALALAPVCDPIADLSCEAKENAVILLFALAVTGTLGPAALVINLELDPSRSAIWFRQIDWVRPVLFLSAIPWFVGGIVIWFVLPFMWGIAIVLVVVARRLAPQRSGREHVVRAVSATTLYALASAVFIVLVAWASAGSATLSVPLSPTGAVVEGSSELGRALNASLTPGNPPSALPPLPPSQTLDGFDGKRPPRCPRAGEAPGADELPIGPCASRGAT